jgi:hypothetical protein
MSELLQVLIVVAFGAFCLGCGYLTAFIVAAGLQIRQACLKGNGAAATIYRS